MKAKYYLYFLRLIRIGLGRARFEKTMCFFYKVAKNRKVVHSAAESALVAKSITRPEELLRYMLDRDFSSAKSFDMPFQKYVNYLVIGLHAPDRSESVNLLEKVRRYKNYSSIYKLLLVALFELEIDERVMLESYVAGKIRVRTATEHKLVCFALMKFFDKYALMDFHSEGWDTELQLKERDKAHAFFLKLCFRKGFHSLAEDLCAKASVTVSRDGPGSFYTSTLEDHLDKRSKRLASAANNACLNLGSSGQRIVGAELDLAAQIFQLPFLKANLESPHFEPICDGLIIDSRLVDFAIWYLPTVKVFGRTPQKDLPRDGSIPQKYFQYLHGVEDQSLSKFHFTWVPYKGQRHLPILRSARNDGIMSTFLDERGIACEEFGLQTGEYVCISLRSNKSSVYRENDWSRLVPKIKKLIGDKDVVNLTPGLTESEALDMSSQLGSKIINPPVDLWNDLFAVAAIMKGASRNITIMNNLMELGGCVGARVHVVDPYYRCVNWERSDGNYFFWKSVDFIR